MPLILLTKQWRIKYEDASEIAIFRIMDITVVGKGKGNTFSDDTFYLIYSYLQ